MSRFPFGVSRLIDLAIEEDLGPGDVTTSVLLDPGTSGKARVLAKEPCVVCGLEIAADVYRRLDPDVEFAPLCAPGEEVEERSVMAQLSGPLASILTGERTALNFLQRMCGVATMSRRYFSTSGKGPVVLDTRKTVPGWRWLDKMAVRTGGCRNHRMGLFDGILIKDNHIAACGSISEALSRAKRNCPPGMVVEVEVDTLAQLDEVLKLGADVIMLDNFSAKEIAEAVDTIDGRAVIEVSGGIRLEAIADCGELRGVDFLSVGELTHSVRAVDVGMEVFPGKRE